MKIVFLGAELRLECSYAYWLAASVSKQEIFKINGFVEILSVMKSWEYSPIPEDGRNV